MRFNRKGMVAVMDAMFFVIILGIAISAIFAYMPQEYDEPMAERVHNDLMRTELRTSDVFDINDTRILPIEEILAAHLTSGEGEIEEYLYEVLRSMIPVSHGFVFECEFKGESLSVGNSDGNVTSSYESQTDVAGSTLFTSLKIF